MFLATCDPSNATSAYSLVSFGYDLYDAETDPSTPELSLGKHVLMPNQDIDGENFCSIRSNDTFTYWFALLLVVGFFVSISWGR